MITVHHLNNSRSHRILWLLEELELPYEVVRYERDSNTMLAPASLSKIHPLGKSPVITDGEMTFAESGLIIEYLVTQYGNGRLKPSTDNPDYWRYLYWLHYAEGSAMPPLFLKLVFDRIQQAKKPFFVRFMVNSIVNKVSKTFIGPQLTKHLDYLEAEIQRTGWFAGHEFSAADIQMSYPLEAAVARAGLDQDRPHLLNFLHRIHQRPAYQSALIRGRA